MTAYRKLTRAETRQALRAAFRVEFPGVKFTVRAVPNTSPGLIAVTWTDGPTADAVKATTERFAAVRYNPVLGYVRTGSLVTFNGHRVYPDSRGVQTRRGISRKAIARAAAATGINLDAPFPIGRTVRAAGVSRVWTNRRLEPVDGRQALTEWLRDLPLT